VYLETRYNITSRRAFPHMRTRHVTVFVILFMFIFNVNMFNVNYLLKIKNVE